MRSFRLNNNKSLEYSNAIFSQNEGMLEITFSPRHLEEEIRESFDPNHLQFSKDNLATMYTLENDLMLSTWYGYTQVHNISSRCSFLYSDINAKIKMYRMT